MFEPRHRMAADERQTQRFGFVADHNLSTADIRHQCACGLKLLQESQDLSDRCSQYGKFGGALSDVIDDFELFCALENFRFIDTGDLDS